MLEIFLYRLYRLRRTILLGIAPSLATVLALSLSTGQSWPVLATLALLVPLAHAVSYPNNWSETLTVSLALSVCLALAATISPDLTLGSLLVRVFWLVFLFFVLFFVAVSPIANLSILGPVSESPVFASATSTLPAEELRKTLTYYPGRADRKVVCGEADAEGRFPVTLRLNFEVPTYQDDPLPEMEEAGISADGVMECHGEAVIHSTGPEHHEIFFFDNGTGAVTASKFSFEALGKHGTHILMEEAGTPLTTGERFGMWVSDYLGDYLTDCIDQAGSRPARANRAFPHKQFVVDLANILVPWLNSQCLDEPSDDRS